ncbi:helix-turn-helix domain-containing protein [Pseudonocardia eucalypti]|uniref:Helix-turn-helix domain-containing protein n=1 Tax=Pseudonocardia eucalypti TaxID=648755 RepID=A0ABP9QGT0_9PSEU|nr:hypothetical protein [Pseudonocardia eucalypti]
MSTDGTHDEPELTFQPIVFAALRARLPAVAQSVVGAVVHEVAEYAVPLQQGNMAANIANAVRLALDGFLRMAQPATGGKQPSGELAIALDGAYALGRGEARSGRSIDSLLAAYRIGARVAWREWGTTAVEQHVSPQEMVRFAERLFAYIDQLSAASVAGHGDELTESGRAREQQRERLGRALLAGAPVDQLIAYAERAGWEPPRTLTVVLVGADRARLLSGVLGGRTLSLAADVAEDRQLPDHVRILLVPNTGDDRSTVWAALGNEPAIVGPCRPWVHARQSYTRAARVLLMHGPAPGGVDTERHLTDLVLNADPEAVADLRARVLAPLNDLPAATAGRLAETLLSWLLHQGRREDVARDLTVHPQTVRYRMTQLRELYGDTLLHRATTLQLILALSGRT